MAGPMQGLTTSVCSPSTFTKQGLFRKTHQHGLKSRFTVLFMSPMSQLCQCVSGEACVCTDETSKFDTATHSAHIRTVFEIFDVSFDECILCQIAEHCSLNGSIADLPHVPHIGCAIQLLNLEEEARSTRMRLSSLVSSLCEIL